MARLLIGGIEHILDVKYIGWIPDISGSQGNLLFSKGKVEPLEPQFYISVVQKLVILKRENIGFHQIRMNGFDNIRRQVIRNIPQCLSMIGDVIIVGSEHDSIRRCVLYIHPKFV